MNKDMSLEEVMKKLKPEVKRTQEISEIIKEAFKPEPPTTGKEAFLHHSQESSRVDTRKTNEASVLSTHPDTNIPSSNIELCKGCNEVHQFNYDVNYKTCSSCGAYVEI